MGSAQVHSLPRDNAQIGRVVASLRLGRSAHVHILGLVAWHSATLGSRVIETRLSAVASLGSRSAVLALNVAGNANGGRRVHDLFNVASFGCGVLFE